MGDFPAWVGAAGAVGQAGVGAGQLYVSVVAARRSAAREFARLLDEALGVPGEEDVAGLLGDERLALLVGQAAEAAARTTAEEKRRMLAAIIAAAMRGTFDDAEVDPVPLLLRTLEVIEPAHLKLLLVTALPRYTDGLFWGSINFGYVHLKIVRRLWPGGSAMVEPLFSGLERENLVARDDDSDARTYSITPFGRLLLRFQEPTLDLTHAYLAAAVGDGQLYVRNTGMTQASDVVVGGQVVGELAPGQDWVLQSFGAPAPPFHLSVTWTDARGMQSRLMVVNPRPSEPQLTLDVPEPQRSVPLSHRP